MEKKLGYLSIIIPCYNVEAYIEQSLVSIIEQDYPFKEIIVVNDGSTDRTLAIVEKINKTSPLIIVTQPNQGLSAARNKGLSMATGEFVTFVDGDDVVAPSTYKVNIEFLIQHNTIGILQYPMLFQWGSHSEHSHAPAAAYRLTDRKRFMKASLKEEFTFSVCDKIFRRESISVFQFRQGVTSEDMYFWIDNYPTLPPLYCSLWGEYKYRFNGESIVRVPKTYAKARFYLDAFHQWIDFSSHWRPLLFLSVKRYAAMIEGELSGWDVSGLTQEEKISLYQQIEQYKPSSAKILISRLLLRIGKRRYRILRNFKQHLNWI